MEQKQPPPKVSVVIASWNNAPALRRCLSAIERSLNPEKIEIIVVDKGSRDESPRLDAEFPKVNLLRLPRNFGSVKALNIGMRTAKGDFFFLLEPEMEVLPETIAALAAALESSPEAAAVCPLLVDAEGRPVQKLRRLPIPPDLYQAWRDGGFADWRVPESVSETLPVAYPKDAALMVRGSFLRGMRFIHERYSESWWKLEICHQILRAGKKILLVPAARAVLHPAVDLDGVLPPAGRALVSSDSAIGAATFVGKHYGWTAGFQFRVKVIGHAFLQAALSLIRMKDVRFHFARFAKLLSGRKIDGTQVEF